MIVYRKGKLKRYVSVDGDIVTIKLIHLKTKVSISVSSNIENKLNDNFTSNGTSLNMDSPYKVIIEDEEGDYVFMKDVWDKEKDLLENYKDAITLFEEKIWEELEEDEPESEPPKPQDEVIHLPEVGDVVSSKDKFGLVTEVNRDTRDIKVKPLTEEEAMDVLRKQSKQEPIDIDKDSVENMTSDELMDFAKGVMGSLSKDVNRIGDAPKMEDGGSLDFFDWNVDKDKVQILRIQPPSGGGGENTPQPPTPPEPKDNYKEVNPSPPEPPTNNLVNPSPPEPPTGGEEVNPSPPEPPIDDDDWTTTGGDGENEKPLSYHINKEKERKIQEDILAELDLEKILEFIGLSKDDAVARFRRPENLINAIGDKELFDTKNKSRIKKAAEKLFK